MTEPPQYPPQYPPPPPGAPGASPAPGAKPDNYLVWSILTTLLCCLPFGVVSIVYAAKVDGLWMAGDYAGARSASENAKKWAIISAAVGVGLALLYLVLVVAVSASFVPSM